LVVPLGAPLRDYVESIGFGARTFGAMLGLSPGLLKRPRLVVEQLHFIGNYSMLIITLSGLFVGMVLGLQGYYTLNKYGAEQSLGLLVALGLTRELGPVVGAAVCRPRRHLADRRNRPDEGRRAAVGHGNDGREPDPARAGAAFLGRRDLGAAAGLGVQRRRRAGRLAGRRAADRRR
jgi:hypothetical protein